jgi:hypothetical protein
MEPRDRRAALLASTSFNGIDFVEVANAAQTSLTVHLLNGVPVGNLTAQPTITGGETVPAVPVLPVSAGDWGYDEGHLVLHLIVAAPGDFSTYTLTIHHRVLDPFFDHAPFSFKALCPSDLDCETLPPVCPPLTAEVPPIDYLAKDFLSFRQALLDFSALRYPQWQERSEADFGMMFLEALSAAADDLSYTQDRIAAEAALTTATQRRSVVRHARLVDYEPGPNVSAAVMLQFDVAAGITEIKDGISVSAQGPDGTPIPFETGMGLARQPVDPLTGAPQAASSRVSTLWNSGQILPYWFDDSERCLKAGATQMYILGHGYAFQPGQQLLIETAAESTADQPLRQIVQLLAAGDAGGNWAIEECDELFTRAVDPSATKPPFLTCPTSPPEGMAPTAVTRIVWRGEDELSADRDLTRTTIAGNIVPATQGKTISSEPFLVTTGTLTTPSTIVRGGPRSTLPDGTPGPASTLQLYTLATPPLAWLPQTTSDGTLLSVPEVLVVQYPASGLPTVWSWFRDILDADEFDTAYTLDAARFRPIQRNSDQTTQYDYDGDAGDTIRFGCNGFGVTPDNGDYFTTTYRIGLGAAGNVTSGAITRLDGSAAISGVIAVTNPLPASGGNDPEPLDSVRRVAPQEFRAQQFRAVIPTDYAAAAQILPWVQRAGTVFRWTGSWLTVFTTPDPRGSEQISIGQRTGLIDLLNRYRMAGYESYVPDPKFVSLDLAIDLCAEPDAFRGDVLGAVRAALSATQPSGFFRADNFTFGQPLQRSALEAAIQHAPGVAGVLCIQLRVRGRIAGFTEMPEVVTVAPDQIIRCDNDPSTPERGSISLNVLGGK